MKPTINLQACALTVASTLASTAAFSATVYDDFVTKWRPLQFGTGTTLEMVRNRLEISLNADAQGDGENFFGRGLFSACAVSGDFDLRTTFRLVDWPLHNGVRAALYLGTIGEIKNRGVYLERDSYSEAEAEGNPIELYVFYADEGATFQEHETEQVSGNLRLGRVGSVVTGYYLSNAQWIELGSSNVGTQDLRFALFVYSHDSVFSDSDVRVAFDTVRLAAGSFTGAACPFVTS